VARTLPLVLLLAASCASPQPVAIAMSGFESNEAAAQRLQDRLVASGRFRVVQGARWIIHGWIANSQTPLIRARVIQTETTEILFLESRLASASAESSVGATVDELADAIIEFQRETLIAR
jgi:hypothetical protein